MSLWNIIKCKKCKFSYMIGYPGEYMHVFVSYCEICCQEVYLSELSKIEDEFSEEFRTLNIIKKIKNFKKPKSKYANLPSMEAYKLIVEEYAKIPEKQHRIYTLSSFGLELTGQNLYLTNENNTTVKLPQNGLCPIENSHKLKLAGIKSCPKCKSKSLDVKFCG